MGVVVAVSIPQEIVKVRLLYEYPPAFSGPLAHPQRLPGGSWCGIGPHEDLLGPGADHPYGV